MLLGRIVLLAAWHGTAQHSTAQHSTAQRACWSAPRSWFAGIDFLAKSDALWPPVLLPATGCSGPTRSVGPLGPLWRMSSTPLAGRSLWSPAAARQARPNRSLALYLTHAPVCLWGLCLRAPCHLVCVNSQPDTTALHPTTAHTPRAHVAPLHPHQLPSCLQWERPPPHHMACTSARCGSGQASPSAGPLLPSCRGRECSRSP